VHRTSLEALPIGPSDRIDHNTLSPPVVDRLVDHGARLGVRRIVEHLHLKPGAREARVGFCARGVGHTRPQAGCALVSRVLHLAGVFDDSRGHVRLIEHGQLYQHLGLLGAALELVGVPQRRLPPAPVQYGHQLIEGAGIEEEELVHRNYTAGERGQADQDLQPVGKRESVSASGSG